MLDSLDSIPWSTLEHAYGDAGDVPNLIRALISIDPDVRGWAQEMLEMGPFHQGSIYSCTPFVVHFMLQIVQEKEATEKPWILQYVSQVLSSAIYYLPSPETLTREPEHTIAEQITFEIRSQLPLLLKMLDNPDVDIRISLLRLLVLLKADLPHLDRVLAEKLKVETEEAMRAALVFCVSLVSDSSQLLPIQAILEEIRESPVVRIASGFGVISTLKEQIPDIVLSDFCAVIASNFVALDRFEDIYGDYLAPLGAPLGKDRLLECLQNGWSPQQRDQIVQALLSIYAQLPTAQSFGIRIGYAHYLEAMILLTFPEGRLSPATTIRDLNNTQRHILEVFQQYDMPSSQWNVSDRSDYRTLLGFTFRSETDFLDFMSSKRSARQTT